MLSLDTIEPEIQAIQAHARLFHTVDGVVYRRGRKATSFEIAELNAGTLRREWLLGEATRLRAPAEPSTESDPASTAPRLDPQVHIRRLLSSAGIIMLVPDE